MTNVDGGAVLLPYIEASGAQSDYAMTMEATLESITDGFGEGRHLFIRFAAELRNSGDIQHVQFLDFDLGPDGDLSEADMAQLVVFKSLEMVGSTSRMYGRGEGFEKWIDITSVVGGGLPGNSGIIPLQAFIEDSELAIMLFEQASGEFDPRDAELIGEETGVSPLLNFVLVPSLPDRLIYEHESDWEQESGLFDIRQTQRIAFRIDPESGFVAHTFNSSQAKFSGFVEGETSSLEQYKIEYNPQDIFVPQPGDPSIETDPDKIAAFLELFE